MTSESQTARRPPVWWLLIGGSMVLLAALGAMAYVTWSRGRELQARVDALLEHNVDIFALYGDYEFVPTEIEEQESAAETAADAVDIEAIPLLPVLLTDDEDASIEAGEGEWVDVDGEGGTISGGTIVFNRCWGIPFHVGDDPPRGIDWLEPVFGDYCFVHVTGVNAYGDVTDKQVPLLLSFPELRELDLSLSSITDVGVRQLTGLTKLVKLDVSWRPLSRETLRQLANCRALRELRITETGADAETVAFLMRELPACRIIE
ncbi:MAG TPA: hypothetical protein VHB77_19365 [Planctomycetaceae bacterium]|nr:hypothetical protein [Planctomycetaceae bacterium]